MRRRTRNAVLCIMAAVSLSCQSPAASPVAAPTGADEPSPAAASTPPREPSPAATPAASDRPGLLEPSEPFGLTTVTLASPDGTTVPMQVYDAHDPDARQLGLMGREELPEGTGMVFRMPKENHGGFWMLNTLIPLSIAFFDADGEVLAVLDMVPCRAEPCPTYDPEVGYHGALEVNRGAFDDIGLEPGWRVELPEDLPQPS